MGGRLNDDGVRRSYDTVAEEYAGRLHDELAGKPLDRALLTALLERAEPGAPIADLGCGPGHVAAWLADRGARAVGVDLSSRMVALGRERYPEVEFREGDLRALPAEAGEFGAAVALYSLIHLAPTDLPRALAEARRVLRPAGPLLLAFHVGDEVRHLGEWWGHPVDVDFHFLDPARVAGLLAEAGFTVEASLERVPYPHEAETRRAYLLARRG
ncbi:class I SAM-dependent methyltransferase [Streptomyces hainanensis]|uniref:Class I SAM-dependent methyltransferase n=1 Tax=Streptomyces hainanensis TaxID=402648 RepID=A0A4R4SJL0_9ACTN|nr:class I SAM-dependent methyltransferase [Streptomyces hainanensis]TDC62222.1 class I SAM-dependent methyltransferase [Streptomyces hainanensis]